MINYENAIRTVIDGGSYVLSELENRIDQLWVEGRLTDAQRAELKRLAAEGARDVFNTNVLERLAKIEHDVYELMHPTDIYPEYQKGQVSERGVVYRADVTGDGELDLVRYDGGRASTALSIGKIEGWHMLDRELNVVANITRDADGGYVVEPLPEPEPAPEGEPTVDSGDGE